MAQPNLLGEQSVWNMTINTYQQYFPDVSFPDTVKTFCQTPDQMPILFSIVMQAALVDIAEAIGKEKSLTMALESLLLSAKLNYQI